MYEGFQVLGILHTLSISAGRTATEATATKVLSYPEAVLTTSTSIFKEIVEIFPGLEDSSSLSVTSLDIDKLARTVHARASEIILEHLGIPSNRARLVQFTGKVNRTQAKGTVQHDKYRQSPNYETKFDHTWST